MQESYKEDVAKGEEKSPEPNGTSAFVAMTYVEARSGASRADSRTRDVAHAFFVRERMTDAGAHWWREL